MQRAATEENDDDEPPEVAAPVRPFASYVNPFPLDGRGDRMPIKEVMRYTFAALQAWGRERNVERQPEERSWNSPNGLAKSSPRWKRR